ncbi:substrate-binding domain-containing protein [Bosea beijingensis]|uniref:LacI family DNA-binding transcriptional regulator n=1 Tax=Bosea beijingensis TaxID=3068632 RepID=UPI0027426459|nr:substrate-binding domain-containing protein [Bosea sp. REN20]
MVETKPAPKRGVFRVAEDAGVSIATVSRTFNEPDLVREDVRKRVIKAAAAVGYVPNSAAKALRLQRTHIVGAVIPTLDHAIYARLVNAFQASLAKAGYTVVVLTVGFDNAHILPAVMQVVERGAEALMVVGKVEDENLLNFLRIKGTPWVQTYSFTPGAAQPAIGFDNKAAISQPIDHLLALGHERLAMISGPLKGNDRQLARVAAFREALGKNGLSEDAPVIEKAYSLADGIEAMKELHASHPDVTAVVCSSDILAFGVLHACRQLGIRVPEDLSVTGFDDLDFAALMDPPLTTVVIGAEEMGRLAGESIAGALDEQRALRPVCLPTTLAIRSSTGRPKA